MIFEVTIYFVHYMQTAKDLGSVKHVEHHTRGFVTESEILIRVNVLDSSDCLYICVEY